MTPADQTVRLVPLSDYLALAAAVAAMRRVQKKTIQYIGKRPAALVDAERRADALVQTAMALEKVPLPGMGDPPRR